MTFRVPKTWHQRQRALLRLCRASAENEDVSLKAQALLKAGCDPCKRTTVRLSPHDPAFAIFHNCNFWLSPPKRRRPTVATCKDTPLHRALANRNFALAARMLDTVPRLKQQDQLMTEALEGIAADPGVLSDGAGYEVVSKLVKKGASVLGQVGSANLPLEVALRIRDEALIELLWEPSLACKEPFKQWNILQAAIFNAAEGRPACQVRRGLDAFFSEGMPLEMALSAAKSAIHHRASEALLTLLPYCRFDLQNRASFLLHFALGSRGIDEDTGGIAIHTLPAGNELSPGHAQVLMALLDGGYDANASLVTGHRPLHLAALFYPAAICLLLEHGADPRLTDAKGHLAEDLSAHPLVQALRARRHTLELAEIPVGADTTKGRL